jgi:MFS family permease
MSAYSSICGLEDETIAQGLNQAPSSDYDPEKNSSYSSSNNVSEFTRRYVLGALYFCNQRPGIFIAPFLLVRGWRESRIGLVLFISGIVGLICQAPAGELTDETPYKRSIIWCSNLLTIIGCFCLLYSESFSVIIFAVSATVVSDAFSFPALYSITLGLVGPKGISEQVPFNESLTHCGNAFFAIISGLVVAFTEGGLAIFWICIIMRLVSCSIVNAISTEQVNVKRARGLEHNDGEMASVPISYYELFTDYHVFIFLLSIFFFHFSNAAMLPLLSQKLFLDNEELGFEFAALAVIIAQMSMVASAMMAGELVKYYGTKVVFLTAIAFIPARGAIILFLLTYFPNNILLLTTQLLDGFAGGAVGVVTVLIAENLSRFVHASLTLFVHLPRLRSLTSHSQRKRKVRLVDWVSPYW